MLVRLSTSTPCCMELHAKAIAANLARQLNRKSHPEKSREPSDARGWPAFADFLREINKCSVFCTCGCNISSSAHRDGAAPFVDIAFSDARLRNSPTASLELSCRLSVLDGASVSAGITVEVSPIGVTLPDGQRANFLRLWILGTRVEATNAFHAILGVLTSQDTADYLAIAELDRVAAAKEHRRSVLKVATFFLVWLVFGLAGAALGQATLGWLAAIGGFIGGLLLFVAIIVAWLWWVFVGSEWLHIRRKRIGGVKTEHGER